MIGPPRPAGEVVFVGIGSNLGDRRSTVEHAVERLSETLQVEAVSSIYESPPEDFLDQGHFLNAVLRGRSLLAPTTLLGVMLGLEREFGRVRGPKSGPRTLDLDLLFFGDRTLNTPGLTLPHPRWRGRVFVEVPLLEVAGDFADPVSGRPVAELAGGDRAGATIRRVGPVRGFPIAVRGFR